MDDQPDPPPAEVADPTMLTVAESADGATTILAASGELDLTTADLLVQHLARVTGNGSGRVVLDLSGLAFIDSSGLRALIIGNRLVEGAGGSLTLRGPSAATRRLLDLTGLSTALTIES